MHAYDISRSSISLTGEEDRRFMHVEYSLNESPHTLRQETIKWVDYVAL